MFIFYFGWKKKHEIIRIVKQIVLDFYPEQWAPYDEKENRTENGPFYDG